MNDKERLEGAREFCMQRADTYRLFASVFDKEIKQKTASDVMELGQVSAQGESKGERMIASGFAGMAQALQGFDDSLETDLAVDYARVFLNAGKHEGQAAIPYESYYTSEEHLLMQDSRDDVRRLFRGASVMPERQMGEIPDDYVVFELEFMALLNERVVKALEKGDRLEARSLALQAQTFLKEHLANWSDEFTKDIAEVASGKFYRYFAKAYRGFLLCEAEDTCSLVDYLTESGDDVDPQCVEPADAAQPQRTDCAEVMVGL